MLADQQDAIQYGVALAVGLVILVALFFAAKPILQVIGTAVHTVIYLTAAAALLYHTPDSLLPPAVRAARATAVAYARVRCLRQHPACAAQH